MGCDFYECLILCVKWKNERGEEKEEKHELTRTARWFYVVIVDSDSDSDSESEEAADRMLNDYMYQIEQRYGEKIVNQDGQWKISSRFSIQTYEKYIPENAKDLLMYTCITCIERD